MYKARLRVIRCLTYLIFVILMGACSSNVISIDSKDSATFTTIETSIPVSKENSTRIKLRASRVSGDYNQTVPDGKLILIDDIQIKGPTVVSGTTDLTYGSISIGAEGIVDEGDDFKKKLRASGYVGLAQTIMNLTLVHEGTTYKTSDKTTELYMQLGLSYAITPSFYGGGDYSMSFGPNLTGLFEVNLKLDYALFKHLQIMGGYRWVDYHYYVEEEESSIKVKFRGPFVGLYIPF